MAIDLIMEFNVLVQHYPIDIFGRWFRLIVTGVIPVAFMNYYPALILLGKSDTESPWPKRRCGPPCSAGSVAIVTAIRV